MTDPDWRMRDLRERIDALDEQIVGLLNERAGCALRIGEIKRETGMPIYQPGRERDVLEHVRRVNAGPARRRRRDAVVRTDHRRGAPPRARGAEGARRGQDRNGYVTGYREPGTGYRVKVGRVLRTRRSGYESEH